MSRGPAQTEDRPRQYTRRRPALWRSKRERLATFLARTGLGSVVRSLGGWRGVVALNYHRIGNPSESPFHPGLFSATQDMFDEHLRFLSRHLDVVRPDDITSGLDRRGRYLLITFDDGYRDNYDRAFPVLRAHGVPATFFVTTGFLGRARVSWWDEIAWMVGRSRRDTMPAGPDLPARLGLTPLHRAETTSELLRVFKTLPADRTEGFLDFVATATGSGRCPDAEASALWMTWDMVRELGDSGMVIGGHTVDHAIMSRLSPDAQERQIRGCAEDLRAQAQMRMRFFSYPVGLPGTFSQHTRACLRACGVELAFGASGGFEHVMGFDPLDFRRTNVTLATSKHLIAAMATLPRLFARD
jgi:peptidoglycan/xylan/chitin deacetylase (PgdA/CDA1 family)